MKKQTVALVLAVALVIGCSMGGTMAWLTSQSDKVTNVFTTSDIDIELTERGDDIDSNTDGEQRNYKMIPGWTIEKAPVVTVKEGSEDCWLFVKITESTTPDFDAYIAYEIADKFDDSTNSGSWQVVQDEDANGVTVIGRKVYKNDGIKKFGILGAGAYTDPMGIEDDTIDDVTVAWEANQVAVKPSVTKQMMKSVEANKPTLTFDAAAVQLYQDNEKEFTLEEAYAKVKWPNPDSVEPTQPTN